MEDILSALRVFFLPPEYNMSSVTRFIRQVPVSTTYYNAAIVAVNATTSISTSMVFELVPSAANIVGNYPPGYVSAASPQLIAALAEAVNTHTAANLVLRDMGKTIYAAIGSSASADFGYFRQVQLLRPSAITSAQGFAGGSAGQVFGVLGGQNIPDAYTDFMTFYIPVAVAGVKGVSVNTQAFAIAGGQM
jgi:hypothetical protein